MEQRERIDVKKNSVAIGSFEGLLSSVPATRRFVAQHLGADFRSADIALLIASELATNAVKHAASPFVVEVAPIAGGVRVSVRDQSTAQVYANVPPSLAESGRGLSLVEALSSAWGVQLAPDGKTVWADIRDS